MTQAICTLCGADWRQDHWTPGCAECGGFAMQTPCLVCGGACGSIFLRSVHDSQDSGVAHWAGACRLPLHEQMAILRRRDG